MSEPHWLAGTMSLSVTGACPAIIELTAAELPPEFFPFEAEPPFVPIEESDKLE